MFNADFFPTPDSVIEQMMFGIDLFGKVILEPSVGKGNIVDYLKNNVGAKEVIGCEIDNDLRKIAQSKCRIISHDFISVKAEAISHIDAIVMNPPFSADEKHILHAWDIAPDGCEIIALCNFQTYNNPYTKERLRLSQLVDTYGSFEDLREAFDDSERSTHVRVGLIRLHKPGSSADEFEGFFMEDEIEEQGNGIMPYNVVREIVNRYVGAVKLFDEQLELGQKMNAMTATFFTSKMAFSCTSDNAPIERSSFKKDLQKSAWNWVFEKMNMKKYATAKLREDINKFVEKQIAVPFTMRNIYKMIEIVIGTTQSRMDRVIIDVFDEMTKHHHENRWNVEGWKTNSHYLMNEKFIMPYICLQDRWFKDSNKISLSRSEKLEDFVKALCYITGTNYDSLQSLYTHVNENKLEYGSLFTWSFFEIRCYKKGTAHLKFKDRDVWARFNQHVARIKGYPLPEAVRKAA